MIGLNTGGLFGGDDLEKIRAFVKQAGSTFPIVEDTVSSSKDYAAGSSISPFPIDVVIAKDGTIAFLTRSYNATEMSAAVERELAK